MTVNKPSAIAEKPFSVMKVNTSKERSFYTQGQQFAARVLFTVWLLASGSPESALAAPKRQGVVVPATTASPGDPSLASVPPTPEGILQLPPGSLWGSSVASTPAIEVALQRAHRLRARTLDKLVGRFWSPRTPEAPRTLAGPVAEGVTEGSSSAAVTSRTATPADIAQGQASELTNKLRSLYQADDKLPKLIEDDDIPAQDIDKYYVKLQAVVQEHAEYAESAAARDKVVGEKKAIKIEEIFDELDKDKEEGEPIGKVLLLGGAGIGKTTLMHYISHQWAHGRLWKGKYAYLFRVRLKELLNNSWKSDYTRDERDEHPLACFIDYCLRNQRIQLLERKKKAFKLCKAAEVQSLLEDPASQHSVLLLVDGYDEIASQSQQGIVKDIVDAILEQDRVIMTSRPNAADKKLRAAFDRQVESQGLDRAGIDQYIDLQFDKGQAGQDLKDFLTKNRQILGMCEVPINTALLCIVWKDPAIREKLQAQSGEDLKLGELYEELVVWLGKRYMSKFEGENPEELPDQFILRKHPIVKTLKEVAYTSFTGEGKEQAAGTLGIKGEYIANTAEKQETKLESVYQYGLLRAAGTLGIKGEYIANTAKKQGTKLKSVYQYGLLRAEGGGKWLKDKTHYFIHLTFQEYLTALRLSEALSQEEGIRKVATHLADHRNEPRYLMTLKFLAGLVSKSNDKELVQRFWEAVSCNVAGVLELGIASKVELLIHLMAQSTTKGELDTRIPNREKLQELVDEEVVKDLARWQEQLIASGYKSAALVRKLREVIYKEQPEENISELSAALEIGLALGSRVVEEEEQQLARHLEEKLLDSPVWQVRALAAAKLAQVLDDKVDRAQASKLLGKLLGLYEEENTNELVAGSSKQLAKKLSELFQDWLQSTYPDVRESALSLIEKLVEADLELAQPMLEAAQRWITDHEWSVRSSALDLMGKLVESAPELAQPMLEAAQRGLKDKEWSVRSSALDLMGKLVESAPELAQPMLEAAQSGLKDKEWSVRESALSLIEKLVEADPELAQPMLEAAQRWITDHEWSVRSSALDLMGKLVESAPELAQPMLEAAQRWITDHEWSVRSSVLDLMGKLVESAPELAQPMLEAAQRGLKDKEWSVRSSALDLMGKLVESAPELAQPMLEAAQRGLKDKEWSVRPSALDLMGKLLSIDAGLAPDLLEAAKTGLKDSWEPVRSSALSLMEKLLSIDARLAPQFLEAAKTGLKDSYSDVRSSALSLIDKLLSIDAGLAPDLLEAAKTGLKDSWEPVRSSALSLMEKLLSIDARLAPQFLEAAKTGLKDSYSDVRSSALSLIDKLLSIDAGLAPDLLEAAKTGLKDSYSDVRSSALFLIGKLLSIDAGLAPDLLEAAKTGLKDSYSDVRSSALSLIDKLLSIDTGLAPQCLEAAQRGINDKDVNVRFQAFELLRKLAETLAKPEIERDALTQLKAQLKKETWRINKSALQTALTFTKLIPASAQQWLELVPYGLRDEKSETQEAAISLGVELASHLPDKAIVLMLLQDLELSVRDKAKERFIQRLQDKTVTYSPQDVLVLDQLLQHSTADSDLDQSLQKEATQKLLELAPQVAENAGLKYLNEHFEKLSHSPAITAFLKRVMHQALADKAIDELEAELITKCILQHGITATIAPGKRRFVLEETRYTLAEHSEAHLQHIVNRVIEKSESQLAQQYKAHQPLFLNTGLGLPIAASDIPRAGSVVNNTALKTNIWHLSVMHLSDHHQQEPQDTFLLLEQRNYEGEHIIKKITYDQGQYTLTYDQARNPNAIDTELRKELFGPMEYDTTKPRYYATCYTLSKEAAQELLGKINQQAGQETQDAYQALHQLALEACKADQNATGSKQLALEWREYVPNAQELEKVDLLQLSQGDAALVRQASSTIETLDSFRTAAGSESQIFIQELKDLASDAQIDQQPDKLAELGEVLLKLAASKQEEAGASAQDLSPYTEAAILYQHVLSICEPKAGTLGSQAASALAQSAYQGLAQIEISMLGQATGAEAGATAPSKPLPARSRKKTGTRWLIYESG